MHALQDASSGWLGEMQRKNLVAGQPHGLAQPACILEVLPHGQVVKRKQLLQQRLAINLPHLLLQSLSHVSFACKCTSQLTESYI